MGSAWSARPTLTSAAREAMRSNFMVMGDGTPTDGVRRERIHLHSAVTMNPVGLLASKAASRHAAAMSELREILGAIRDEVEAALGSRGALPNGVRLEAERVTVSLSVSPGRDSSGALILEAKTRDSVTGTTAVQVEFRVYRELDVVAAPPSEPADLTTAATAKAVGPEGIAEACERVFGPPGFDNAARAEVFCELAAGIGLRALSEALDWVEKGTILEGDNQAVPVVGRLRQLLGFAPAGRERAAGLLLGLLKVHPLPRVLGILGERWKFGTHWTLPESTQG